MDRRATGVALLAVLGLTLFAWSGTLHGSFHYDDFDNVVRDPVTVHPTGIGYRLLHGIRPLTRLSYALDYAQGGMEAPRFLLTNLFLHLATVAGVALLATASLQTVGAGFWAAAIFALQPAAVETVAYVSGRSTGLMSASIVWGLVAHAGAGPFASVTRWQRAMTAAILFAAACLAKEVALVFPLWLMLWDRFSLRRDPVRRNAVPQTLAWTIAGVSAMAALASSHLRDLLAYSLDRRSPVESLADNARALPSILSLWIRPDRLSIVYPFDGAASVWPGVALATALLCAAVGLWRRLPTAAFAAGWILTTLIPTHSLFARNEIITAKPLYLAWLGPAFLLASGLEQVTKATRMGRTLPRLTLGTAMLALFGAGVSVRREVATWSSELSLWARAVRVAPERAVAWNDYGNALLSASHYGQATAAFDRALALEPGVTAFQQGFDTAQLLCGESCAQTTQAKSRGVNR